jgi:acetyl esterase/lipase
MELDPQARALLDQMEEAGAPRFCEGNPAQARAVFAEMAEMVGAGPTEVELSSLQIPVGDAAIGGRALMPPGKPRGTIVYLHGGGWVIDGLDTHTPMCRCLAAGSGCQVVMVDYRVAPEHPFPTPLEDADLALAWAGSAFAAEGPVVVAGDSAGANLAAVAARRARDRGQDLALQVLLYPVLDSRNDTGSYATRGDGYALTAAEMAWFWRHYLPEPERRSDPDASPLRAETLAGMAPAYLAVAGYDPLRDEGIAYAERLRRAGVPTQLELYEDQMHGFTVLIDVLDAARRAVEAAGLAIRAAVEAAAGPSTPT